MKNIILSLSLFVSIWGYGQQDQLFSQYMINPSNFNPAYTGSRGVNTLFLQHRQQWLGLDGSPTQSYFNYQSSIELSRLGIGLNYVSDKIGVLDENELSVDVAYHLPVSSEGRISIGLKGTADFWAMDYSELNLYEEDDLINEGDSFDFKPNIGFGVYYYDSNFYAGFSAPFILNRTFVDSNMGLSYEESTHYFGAIGYVYELNRAVKLKPSLFIRWVNGVPAQYDLSLNALFEELFQIGGTYRFGTAYSIMAGLQVSDQFLVGYSYDQEITDLSGTNRGSHELFLRYEFSLSKTRKVQSPRFF